MCKSSGNAAINLNFPLTWSRIFHEGAWLHVVNHTRKRERERERKRAAIDDRNREIFPHFLPLSLSLSLFLSLSVFKPADCEPSFSSAHATSRVFSICLPFAFPDFIKHRLHATTVSEEEGVHLGEHFTPAGVHERGVHKLRKVNDSLPRKRHRFTVQRPWIMPGDTYLESIKLLLARSCHSHLTSFPLAWFASATQSIRESRAERQRLSSRTSKNGFRF